MFTLVLGVASVSKAYVTGHMTDLTFFCGTKLDFLFTAKYGKKRVGKQRNETLTILCIQ